jgi:hypothetical protein
MSRIVASDPAFFEQRIIDLMLAMGYGGSHIGPAPRIAGICWQLGRPGSTEGRIPHDVHLHADRPSIMSSPCLIGSDSFGDQRTKLIIGYNVGVRTARTVDLKRVDLDYFGANKEE